MTAPRANPRFFGKSTGRVFKSTESPVNWTKYRLYGTLIARLRTANKGETVTERKIARSKPSLSSDDEISTTKTQVIPEEELQLLRRLSSTPPPIPTAARRDHACPEPPDAA